MNLEETKERRKKVKELRESGMTFTAIGKQIGVCTQRASQLYKLALRDEQREKRQQYLLQLLEESRKRDARYVFKDYLPARALNALFRGGINTFEDLRATSPDRIMRLRNVGKKTFDLIMKVRGVREKEKT